MNQRHVWSAMALMVCAAGAMAQPLARPEFPEGVDVTRQMSAAEKAWAEMNPAGVPRGTFPVPSAGSRAPGVSRCGALKNARDRSSTLPGSVQDVEHDV